MLSPVSKSDLSSTPLLLLSSSLPSSLPSSSTSSSNNGGDTTDDTSTSPDLSSSNRFDVVKFRFSSLPLSGFSSYRSLAVLSGHIGSVSCLALCGEFILSASQGKDIIVWQQPDLKIFTKFGHGDGSVKALVSVGDKVFTAHQDSRIRVWKVSSRSSENVFRMVDSLPTTKDYLGRFMKQSNYVQTRRHHKKLWIEHADSISCLAVCDGLIYSGSWDKTLKVWRLSDLKCLESIKAHEDAINGLVSCKGVVYSASADGKIKAWSKGKEETTHSLKGVLEGHNKDVSFNSVVVSDDGVWVFGGGSDGYVMGWEKKKKKNYNGVSSSSSSSSSSSCSWEMVSETKAHPMAVLCMCLVGEFLCSGSADKSIVVWKREAFGKICKVGVINGHEGPVKCLQASCNNRIGGGFLLYSGSLDKTLRVWWVPKYNNQEIEDSCYVTQSLDRAITTRSKVLAENSSFYSTAANPSITQFDYESATVQVDKQPSSKDITRRNSFYSTLGQFDYDSTLTHTSVMGQLLPHLSSQRPSSGSLNKSIMSCQ
ncbi:protein JINGUBANG [Senna tora]|uniref:Protein JINGUBANG n=1 Tax=Senna tora TaxID=362788 RepID=A0A834TLV0_9FABA|nr:protein JINGUBANG [Senna tora]